MRFKFAAFSLIVVMVLTLVSCNQGKIDELTQSLANLEVQNQQLMQENNAIKAYIEEVVKVVKSVDQDLEKIMAAEVDIREMTKDVDINAIEGNIKNKLGEIGDYIVESKAKIVELETSLAETKHEVKGLRSLVANVKANLKAKEDEITKLAAEMGVLEDDLASLNNEIEQKNSTISEQEDMIAEQNTRYYTMAKASELKDRGILEKRGGFLFFGKTTKLTTNFSTADFNTLDAVSDLELTIPVPSNKVMIHTPHIAGSYQLVDAGENTTLMISDPSAFWSASKCLVVETK